VRAVGANVAGFDVGQPVAALLNDFGRTQRAGGYARVAIAHQAMTTVLGTDTDLPVVTGAAAGLAGSQPVWRQWFRAGEWSGWSAVTRRGRRCSARMSCLPTISSTGWESPGNAVDVVIDPVGGRSRQLLFDHLAPFGRHVVLGNASGEDILISSDATWHGTRALTGLSLGAVAHLRPETIKTALTAVVALIDRGLLAEPAPDVQPLTQVRRVHQALENRSAPAKTVLDVSR
jgi:NADPH2:quinone reductase